MNKQTVCRCGYSEARKSTGGMGPVRNWDYRCPNPANWEYTNEDGRKRYSCNARAHQVFEAGWTKRRIQNQQGRRVY